MVAAKAQIVSDETRQRFTTAKGKPVIIVQDEYAGLLLWLAKQPVSEETFLRLSEVIAREVPDIIGVSTIRQDLVPFVSEKCTPKYTGELRIEYEFEEPTSEAQSNDDEFDHHGRPVIEQS
jgi:hypothetical protein